MRRICLLVLMLSALVGCGVPLQNVAQPVEGVITASPAPTPVPTGPAKRFWFVRDDGLVSVMETAPTPVRAVDLLARLAAGPPAVPPGLRSLVTDPAGGPPLVAAAPDQEVVQGEPVTVILSPSFSALPPSEQPLLLGQVVLTLTGAGASAVLVTDEQGAPVSVPAADGKVVTGTVTAGDYSSLVASDQGSPSPGG